MKLMSHFSENTVQRQLIIIIVLTLAVGLGVKAVFSIKSNIENMKKAEESKIDLLSSAISKGIKTAMVTGNADIVIDWLSSVRDTGGLKQLKVFRKNGVEAFMDNVTINDVNKYLDDEVFSERTISEPPGKFDNNHIDEFKKAVDSAREVSYDEELNGEPIHTRLIPILKDDRCKTCHGYDEHPVRDILKISISKVELLGGIKNNIIWAIISSVLVILAVGIIMSFLINKEIIKPITMAILKISSAGDQQDRVTSQQASSVHQITTTIEELSSSSKQVNAKAESLAEQSKEALSVAFEGQKAIDRSISEMNLIKKNVAEIAEDVLHLSENTNQIGAIINVVGDIANKTDMLAVNAAIEAAKAGEHGKGFAVVASEVRSLADQSKKATEKITSLIQEIQNAVNSTVMTTEEGGKKVDSGVSDILEVGLTINNTIDTIKSTAEAANEIAIASRQESLATDQVAEAMVQINKGMQESSAETKDSILSIQQLRKLVDRRASRENDLNRLKSDMDEDA